MSDKVRAVREARLVASLTCGASWDRMQRGFGGNHMQHQGQRGWAALVGLMASCSVGLAAAPAAARVTSNFVLEPPSASEPTDGEMEFGFWRNWGVILSRQAHAERAVKLTDAALIVGGKDILGGSRTADLKAGDVLVGSEAKPGVYCKPAQHGEVCLEDADGDGRFERARMALCDYAGGLKYDLIAWTDTGRLCPFRFLSEDVILASPLGFVRFDPAQGPSVWANLTMNKTGGGKGDKPLTFLLKWELGEKGSPEGQVPGDIWVTNYALPADGIGKIDLHGMVVEFQGYTPDHKLRYRVLTPMPSVRLQAWAPLRRGY